MSKQHNKYALRSIEKNSLHKVHVVGGVVFIYELDMMALQTLCGYVFQKSDDNWQRFVYNNRIKTNEFLSCAAGVNQQTPPIYDYVIGPLADGLMVRISDVEQGKLAVADFMRNLISIGDQISFHTNRSLMCLKRTGVFWC